MDASSSGNSNPAIPQALVSTNGMPPAATVQSLARASTTPRIWLITGTTSGLGRRMALSALRRGDRVIGTGRSEAKLQQVKDGLAPGTASNFHGIVLDVTEGGESIKAKVDEATKVWGGIDVLVNNAGFGIPSLMEEAGNNILRPLFDTNVFGVVDVTVATLPHLRNSKRPALVVIGSRSAFKAGVPGLGPYAATKAAIHSVTESWMVELAPFNIPVMLVQPGAFPTEGILGQKYYVGNQIPAYDNLRNASLKAFAARPGSEKGDPDKAAEVVVDIVRQEGVAVGRPWPNYLPLGEDAEEDIRSKLGIWTKHLDDWADVARSVNFEGGKQPESYSKMVTGWATSS